ncbi:L-seryl-tRNA(Sec) selenium transferase [Campylobacter novaezeelandiae]|uniref:L-seryl-tRNA(Sec) selenium transferase n=2 Tax=Campylobacter novaezeelandiae TaxID=2267891 RepID=UPI00190891D6|nr:L-seryl-tRNA(Sec) selenium transferase [Campylobacter novaezeelandiae]MBK1964323.1 L-seryl-tRNA(Sec) selenium transferase [Campylobacter novaezeelandiae]
MDKFRNFPQISSLIQDENLKTYPLYLRTYFSKCVIKEMKKKLQKNLNENIEKTAILNEIQNKIKHFLKNDLQNLINASGVVIHTNLGRSVIDEELYENCKKLICSYSNLEFDLQTGKRGSRYDSLLEKFKILFECEDALVVNNNAAAVFLILNTLAKDKEVISSRGELVEIGGSFRIPEVIKAAGVKLHEVGTSNKTHLKDYEEAINENSALILKTHKSNFSLLGFQSETNLEELKILSKKKKLILYYDLGSGWCENLNPHLSKNEPEVKKLLKNCDILSFSGDKLFGSVQAGIILGKKKFIEKLKRNQLLRMLRVDKLSITFLNETLKFYLEKKFEKITTLKLLNDSLDHIKQKALKVQKNIKFKTSLQKSKSLVGGGSMPDKSLETFVLAFEGKALFLQKKFREKNIIGRVENKNFILDFRSIKEDELPHLINIINSMDTL